MGKPCVAGLDALRIDRRTGTISIGETKLAEGDLITIDGSTGEVMVGRLELIPPPSKLPDWLAEFLSLADKRKRLGVWANADTPDAMPQARARSRRDRDRAVLRTEHMFMEKERLPIVQAMIMAPDLPTREAALERLLPFQRADFKGILSAMEGCTVTIRLLDPPLHEFLPQMEQLVVETTELRILKVSTIRSISVSRPS